ncbi:hypothetical protein J6590_005891 [Homalodisca vitripennis]|nr:hypothetical protein J6590_005891 [Homalodisca vitripennis]
MAALYLVSRLFDCKCSVDFSAPQELIRSNSVRQVVYGSWQCSHGRPQTHAVLAVTAPWKLRELASGLPASQISHPQRTPSPSLHSTFFIISSMKQCDC